MQDTISLSKWQHEHHFHKKNHTCVLEDIITYRLPLGNIGRWIGDKWVRGQLERLFEYRHHVTAQDIEQWRKVESMKILLAGASGLIGSALRPCLIGAGHEVYTLVRRQEEMNEQTILWNPNQGSITPADLEGFDAVINFSGDNIASQRWSEAKKQRILESRVKTTRLLADTLAYLERPPKVWINASAVGYYGDQGDRVVDEESSNGEGFLAHVCKEWEEATSEAKEKGIRVVTARFGVVLSPKGGVLGRLLTPFKLGLGGMIGNGGQYMSWIAIDDLLSVIQHLLKTQSIEGPVNVVTPYPISNYTFTKALGSVLKRPTVLPLPAFAAKLAFGKEMAEEMLLSSTRAQPKKLIDSGFVFHYPKIEKALKNCLLS